MGWTGGQKYRGRAVSGEFVIKKIGENETSMYEGLIEVTMGPQQGQRIRYRGYLSSPKGRDAATKNQEITANELRAMGARLDRAAGGWKDLQGLGTKEVQFTCMTDRATDGSDNVFFRASFVKPVQTIDRSKNVASADDIDALPPPPVKAQANGAPPPRGGDSYDGPPDDGADELPI